MVGDLILQSVSKSMLGQKSYGAAQAANKKAQATGKRPIMQMLGACLVVPLFIFLSTFWIWSFDVHYQSKEIAFALCLLLLLVPLVFGYTAFTISNAGGNAGPMCLLFVMSGAAWLLGYGIGGNNFTTFMQPYYDVKRLNVYPSVDPSMYGGQQMMDAGQIQFVPSAHLGLDKAIGFKDGEMYCVAPIVTGDTNKTQTRFDFWAVGMNCCSGHMSDFRCGETTSADPHVGMSGLRLMDSSKRDMFRLVVQKAAAEYNLDVKHPMFLYWLSHPDNEVQAYHDDGWGHFLTASAYFFCAQVFIVGCATIVFSKLF